MGRHEPISALPLDVADFHDRYELAPLTRPGFLSEEESEFRITCLDEEVTEFEDAVKAKDLAGAADALVDLVYFAIGTADRMGIPFDAVWAAVHEANMKKQLATKPEDSKRGFKRDVIKPEGWVAPDIAAVLAEHNKALDAVGLDDKQKKEG